MGSGIVGSIEAAILAKHGYDVLLLEKGAHPRFALGEATLPQSSYWMWLISERYDIPELKQLSNADNVANSVSHRCGIKRSIGFAYHRPGEPQDPNETNQFVPPEYAYVSESHFFREDVDHFMVKTAVKYGATLRENAEVVDVDTDESGVCVTLKLGEVLNGRYLVDATGAKSLVAEKYGLRETPTRLVTQSRSIFTHARNLRPYDDFLDPDDLPGLSYSFHEGTLHHAFDGGWFWVIPFDNHAGSRNKLASIGLTLNMCKHPSSGLSAEAEVKEIMARYPSIAAHFESIEPIMPWIGTGRLQYSAKRSIGTRFFITTQAYGAVDALYSRGLINSLESLYYFTYRLIDALNEDDFSEERFAPVDEAQRKHLDEHDQMVNTGYMAMSHYVTWNAWLKVWISTKLYGDLWLMRTALRYAHTGDKSVLAELDTDTHVPFAEPMQHNIDLAGRVLNQVERGETTANDAAEQILSAMRSSDWLPHLIFGWGEANERHVDFSADNRMPKGLEWGKTVAPQWLRDHVFDFPLEPLMEAMAKHDQAVS